MISAYAVKCGIKFQSIDTLVFVPFAKPESHDHNKSTSNSMN